MHSCCAVDASGGEGAIAGFSLLFAAETGEVVGVVELGCGLPRERGGCRVFPVPVASMTRGGQGESAVPFYLRVF